MISVTARRAVFLSALLLSITACTDNAGTSTSPTTGQSLFAPQFSGSFVGNAVLTGVTAVANGECVQPALQAQVDTDAGTERVNLTIAQDGQALLARLSSSTTGLSCSYQGSAALNTLALNTAACDAETLIVRCPSGAVRELELIGSTVQGTVSAGQVTGTLANSYNVFDNVTGFGVTRVTLNYDFSAVKP